MNIKAQKSTLSGHITVPGSKSHTIRALLLATLADGVSHIANPLPSADCISTAHAIPLIGAEVDMGMSGTYSYSQIHNYQLSILNAQFSIIQFPSGEVIQFLNSEALFLLTKRGSGNSIGIFSSRRLSNQTIISFTQSRATMYCLLARKNREGSSPTMIESKERL